MIQKRLISALVLFLPFFIFPFGTSFFEIPKVVVAEVGIEVLLLVTLWRGNLNWCRSWNIIPFVLLFIFSVYRFFISPDPTLLFGNIFRFQGVFLLWHLILFAILSSKINLEKKGALFLILPGILLTLTLLSFILGITQAGRAVGTLGESNSLSAVAIFFLPFVFLKSRWFMKVVVFIVVLETILLAGSRSGVYSLFLTLIFLVLSNDLILGVKKASIVGFLLLVIGFSFPLIEGGGWFENRAEIWQTAFQAGMHSPLIGNGFGNIQASLAETAIILNNNVQYQIVDSSHNIFLDFWVQGGAIGLLLFLCVLILAIYRFLVAENRLMIALLLGLLASLSLNPLSVCVLIMLWYVLGQGLFKSTESNNQ